MESRAQYVTLHQLEDSKDGRGRSSDKHDWDLGWLIFALLQDQSRGLGYSYGGLVIQQVRSVLSHRLCMMKALWADSHVVLILPRLCSLTGSGTPAS